MTKQWSLIPAWEVHGTRREWVDSDLRPRASVLLMCDWDKRGLLLEDLLTSNVSFQWRTNNSLDLTNLTSDRIRVSAADTGNHYRTIYCPRAYPDYNTGELIQPKLQPLGVTAVSFESEPECYTTDASQQVMQMKNAFLRVEYGTFYNIEEEIEFQTKYNTIDARNLTWFDNSSDAVSGDYKAKPENVVAPLDTPAQVWYEAIFSRTLRGCNVDMVRVIQEAIGRTNQWQYQSKQLNRIFRPQTLLMIDPVVSQSFNVEGKKTSPGGMAGDWQENDQFSAGVTIKLRFLYRTVEKLDGDFDLEDLDYYGTHNIFWQAFLKPKILDTPRTNNPLYPVSASRGEWNKIKQFDPDNLAASYVSLPFYRPFIESQTVDRFLYNRFQIAAVEAPNTPVYKQDNNQNPE